MSRVNSRMVGAVVLAAAVSMMIPAAPLHAAGTRQAPAATAPAAAALSATDAAPFLGDWAVTADSQMGPMAFNISVKVDDSKKVVAEVSSDQQAKTTVNDVTKSGASLVLRYNFDYQGMDVPVMITLTIDADKLKADFSFADGQFTMLGVGTKKT